MASSKTISDFIIVRTSTLSAIFPAASSNIFHHPLAGEGQIKKRDLEITLVDSFLNPKEDAECTEVHRDAEKKNGTTEGENYN
jgi:hypothetical protein